MRLLYLLFLLKVIVITDVYAKKITFKEFDINGFKAFLINTRQGNRVTLAFNVEAGSLHDDPSEHPGRAHLWEHYIHRGSEKFPKGRSKISELSIRLGDTRNAGTSPSRVLYYLNMHPDALHEAIEFLGAMSSRPKWDLKQFDLEKLTVMNEALEYQSNFMRASNEALFLEALPPNHPFKMYSIGSQEKLKKMTVEDIKDLYYSTYTPQGAQIIVAGNFDPLLSSPAPLNEKEVISLLKKNFFPPDMNKDPDGFKTTSVSLTEKKIPSITEDFNTSSKQKRIIEFKKPDRQISLYKAVFEIPQDISRQNPEALEIFVDFLNQDVSGTLKNYLKEKGLILEMNGYTYDINNITLLSLNFTLTSNGEKLKHTIMDYFFLLLNRVKTSGFDPQVLSHLKKMNIISYENDLKDTETITNLFVNFYKRAGKDALNFEKRFNRVTSDMLTHIAERAFDPEKMIAGYFGSDVKSKNLSSIFNFPFKEAKSKNLISRWKSVLANGSYDLKFPDKIILPEMKFDFAKIVLPGNNRKARMLKKSREGIDVLLKEDHTSPTGALLLKLIMQADNIESNAALKIFTIAFLKRYSSDIDFFRSSQLLGSGDLIENLKVDNSGLNLFFSGNRGPHEFMVDWFVKRLKDFQPTYDEIEYAKNILASFVMQRQNGFSAHIAIDMAQSLLLKNGFSLEALSETASKMTYNEILSLSQNLFIKTDLIMIASGDYNSNYLLNLVSKFEKEFPERLDKETRKDLKNYLIKPKNRIEYWAPLSPKREEGSIGLVDIFTVNELNDREKIALKIYTKSLHKNVFYLNRELKGLGYAQGAYSQILKTHGFITMYGQTDKKKNWKELANGLERIIDWSFKKKLRTNDFINEKTGVLRAERIISSVDVVNVEKMFTEFRAFGRHDYTSKIVSLSNELTPDEIYEVGNRFLSRKEPVLSVYATKETTCKNLFTKFLEAKKMLIGK